MVQAPLTIVLLVSRDFLLDKIFECLDKLECSNASLLVLVDGDLNLFLKARNLTVKSKFESLCIRAKDYGRRSPSQQYRRRRIASLHNEAKDYIKPCKYILCIEDDGLFGADALSKLLEVYEIYPEAGFVEGLQIGRWQSQYIGAWVFDDVHEPNQISSIPYEPNKITEIDSGGLFFCLTKYKHYILHHFEPTNNWGPDIVYGLALRNKGLKNYIDQSVLLDHINERSGRVFNIQNDTPKIVSFKNHRGVWRAVLKVAKN